jgi:hypothetical protein
MIVRGVYRVSVCQYQLNIGSCYQMTPYASQSLSLCDSVDIMVRSSDNGECASSDLQQTFFWLQHRDGEGRFSKAEMSCPPVPPSLSKSCISIPILRSSLFLRYSLLPAAFVVFSRGSSMSLNAKTSTTRDTDTRCHDNIVVLLCRCLISSLKGGSLSPFRNISTSPWKAYYR